MAPLFELECWIKRFYRQGPRFQQMLAQLEKSARLDSANLAAYQNRYLQRMVQHCVNNVPYYRELFRRLRLTPEDIQTTEDLRHLPVMDKHTVRENFDRLIARGHQNLLCRMGSTSGSTGTPGKFLRDYQAINFENAAAWRHWRAAGDNGLKRLTVRGDVIVPVSQSRPPFWKINPANRELLMSGYHLSLGNSEAYIQQIAEFEPGIFYCYPSTAYLMAKFYRAHNLTHRFRAIFTSSESLDDDVRRYVEETFDSPIFDWYGQAERVAAVAQCARGTYHIQEDYSVVELNETSHGYELVGTHLFNFVMPLLRYCTGDLVEMPTHDGVIRERPCGCGSAFRSVERIYGRNFNYIITPEGYRVSVMNHIPRGVENLIETQFVQEKPGEVVLKVLTNGRFTERDRALLIKNTLAHTSPKMKVEVTEVDALPRGPNGKFVSIVNQVEQVSG